MRLHAFIDEAGQRSSSQRSSDHFVLSAVIIPEDFLPSAAALLAQLRSELRRRPGDPLHWRNLKGHAPRVHAAKTLGSAGTTTVSSVVVCKRHLPPSELDEDQAYLYTLRFLLERMSWYARDVGAELTYTLAHVVRFKLEKLRAYEERLRAMWWGCQIAWGNLDSRGGHIDQPNRIEFLQLADVAASATFAAFEPDQFGNTEVRYLQELAPALYRRSGGALTSYGLKMHPWRDATKAAYPWVAAL